MAAILVRPHHDRLSSACVLTAADNWGFTGRIGSCGSVCLESARQRRQRAAAYGMERPTMRMMLGGSTGEWGSRVCHRPWQWRTPRARKPRGTASDGSRRGASRGECPPATSDMCPLSGVEWNGGSLPRCLGRQDPPAASLRGRLRRRVLRHRHLLSGFSVTAASRGTSALKSA
eukprot:COSAG01_NODE_53_length_31352_cov_23.122452_33_plen_174_part_00